MSVKTLLKLLNFYIYFTYEVNNEAFTSLYCTTYECVLVHTTLILLELLSLNGTYFLSGTFLKSLSAHFRVCLIITAPPPQHSVTPASRPSQQLHMSSHFCTRKGHYDDVRDFGQNLRLGENSTWKNLSDFTLPSSSS